MIVAALKSEVKTVLDRWGIARQSTLGKHASRYECLNGVAILRTGIGLRQTARIMAIISNSGELPPAILHIGVSGALSNGFEIGQMVRGTTFSNESDAELNPAVWSPFEPVNSLPEVGFLSVSEAVKTTKDRDRLHAITGAKLVDMESYAVAAFCLKNDIPLCAIRIVSDRADDFAMATFRQEFREQAHRLQEFVLDNWVT